MALQPGLLYISKHDIPPSLQWSMAEPYKSFKGQAKGQVYSDPWLKSKWTFSCEEEGIKSTTSRFPFLYSEQSLLYFFTGTSFQNK